MQVPAPYNPNEIAKIYAEIKKQIDDLETNEESHALHDFLQDKLVPFLGLVADQIGRVSMWAAAHEDRISELEAVQDSILLPEDADKILEYLEKSIDVFKAIKTTSSIPGVDELIKKGEAAIDLVESITVDEDEDEEDDEEVKK
jgi:hypothetical protein